MRQLAIGTYDNFNFVISGLKGVLAGGAGFVLETLMTPALDEVSASYGLLADGVRHPPDFSSVTYRLRPQAKWHDGRPVTPEDVIFSFDVLKKHNPLYAAYYRHVVKAQRTGEREVTFLFDGPGNRELPEITGQLRIVPVGRHRRVRQQPGRRCHVARTAARFRTLPRQGFHGRQDHRLRARSGLLGQGRQRQHRPA